jgi:hypothetical protein
VNEGQANSITTSMIVDSAVTNPKIALNAVNYSQIQQVSCPSGQALRVLGGGTYTCVDLSQYGNVTGSGSANYVAKWTGASTLGTSIIQDTGNVSIDAGTLFVDASNDRVGIGTTAPGAKLDIRQTPSGVGLQIVKNASWDNEHIRLILDQAGDPRVGIWLSGTDGYLMFRNRLGGYWFFQGDSTTTKPFVIDNAGNVGIGTTAPSEKLTVIGNIRHTGSIIGGTTYSFTWMRMPSEDPAGNMLALGAGGTTILGSGESYDAVSPNFGASDEVLILSSDNAIRFITNLQNGWSSRVDAMTITSSGNVGIGTTSPGQKLTVAGQVYSTSSFTGDAIAGAGGLPGQGFGLSDDSDAGGIMLRNYGSNRKDTVIWWGDDADDNLRFQSANWNGSHMVLNDRMIITAGGNVGIGTTAPAYKLDVAGTLRSSQMRIGPGGFGNYYEILNDMLYYPATLPRLDALDFKTPTAIEYYDGTSWVTWSGVDTSPLNDGMYNNNFVVDYTHRQFRVTYDVGQYGEELDWLTIVGELWFKTVSVTIEGSSDGTTWYTRATGTIPTARHMVSMRTGWSAGDKYIRITFDIPLASGESYYITELDLLTTDPYYYTPLFTSYRDRSISMPNNLYVSGNVGIGTTSPGEKLEVSGNVKLSGYINVAGSYIRKVGSSIVISDV